MTPYLDALELILSRVQPLPSERVPLELAAGRALSSALVAPVTLPPADNSAMDGYALRAGDTVNASETRPAVLQVVQRITAGDRVELALSSGQAARIMTGGVLPPGSDAVVKQEDVTRDGDALQIPEPCEPGENVRRAGEDIRAGDTAVDSGATLTASELALLASLGQTHVSVHRRPRVAVLSTGDEIAELGSNRPGKLVDSNALALSIRLRELGCEVVALGVAPDDPEAIRARFEAARGCDVVISSAGVSVGEKDYVKSVLQALGAELHLEKVAIRPGKPLVFATTATQLFFGLPGNPVSSRVTFEVFVRPALRKLMGHRQPQVEPVAVLARDFPKPESLTFFARARLHREGQTLLVNPVAKQNSNYLTSLVGADVLAVLPAGEAHPKAGTVVDIIPLSGW